MIKEKSLNFLGESPTHLQMPEKLGLEPAYSNTFSKRVWKTPLLVSFFPLLGSENDENGSEFDL